MPSILWRIFAVFIYVCGGIAYSFYLYVFRLFSVVAAAAVAFFIQCFSTISNDTHIVDIHRETGRNVND